MQVTRRQLNAYREGISRIANAPKARLLAALQTLEWNDVTRDANMAVSLMRSACQSGSDLAAVAASEFYTAMRGSALGGQFSAIAASGFNGDATEGAVRAFVESVMHGDVAGFEDHCLARYDAEVRNAARHCIDENARRDRAEVSYALVPQGDCCDYCAELAALGFNGNWGNWDGHVHEHCSCVTVPGFDGQTTVEGYDPDRYAEQVAASGSDELYEMPF